MIALVLVLLDGHTCLHVVSSQYEPPRQFPEHERAQESQAMQPAAQQLVDYARQHDLMVSIANEPQQALAMGNYLPVIEARKHAMAADTHPHPLAGMIDGYGPIRSPALSARASNTSARVSASPARGASPTTWPPY